MREDRQQKTKRRFKTGQWVQYDGLYSDDWGGDLVLMQGELFPSHPQMGETSWTYTGPSVLDYGGKAPKMNGHHIGY